MVSIKKLPKPGGAFKHRTLIRDTVAILQDKWGWNAAMDAVYRTDSGDEVRPDVVAIPPDALRRRGEKNGWIEYQNSNITVKSEEAMNRYLDGLNRTFSEPLIIDIKKVWTDSTIKRFENIERYIEIKFPKWKRRN